jgi:hypothetical protein
MTYSCWDVTSILHTGKGETRHGMSVHMFGARASTVLYISGDCVCVFVSVVWYLQSVFTFVSSFPSQFIPHLRLFLFVAMIACNGFTNTIVSCSSTSCSFYSSTTISVV